MKQSLFQGQLKFDLMCSEDETTVCSESGCDGKLSPQKSWLDYPEESNTDSKADSHLAIHDRFPGGETYQL